jgi:hypothetical protein
VALQYAALQYADSTWPLQYGTPPDRPICGRAIDRSGTAANPRQYGTPPAAPLQYAAPQYATDTLNRSFHRRTAQHPDPTRHFFGRPFQLLDTLRIEAEQVERRFLKRGRLGKKRGESRFGTTSMNIAESNHNATDLGSPLHGYRSGTKSWLNP